MLTKLKILHNYSLIALLYLHSWIMNEVSVQQDQFKCSPRASLQHTSHNVVILFTCPVKTLINKTKGNTLFYN